jgi:hypothetical protein
LQHAPVHLNAAIAPIVIEASRYGAATGQRERRNAPRTAMVFTIGKLICDGVEFSCMVRNLSTGGMQVQLPAPPSQGASVVVEMHGLSPRPARVSWSKGRVAGLRFATPCSVDDVLKARRGSSGSPRFRLNRPCAIQSGGASVAVLATDISVNEVRLVASAPLVMGQDATLSLSLGPAGLSPVGKVGWVAGDRHGFVFDPPLSSVMLAHALQGVCA